MRFVVVDLEATCWSEISQPALYAQQAEVSEIIEIGAVMLDDALQPIEEFQRFIHPVRCPILSDFCTSLTSITQADVERAERFVPVYEAFLAWMGGSKGVGLVSWGRYDHNQLVREATASGLPLPSWTPLNAKEEFTAWVRSHTGQRLRYGMGRAMTHLEIPFTGTAHRGIDDARNLVRIFQRLRSLEHRSSNASRVLEVLTGRYPKPAHIGHLRARWPDAKTWFPQARKELLRLRLVVDSGQGRGLMLTDRGAALVGGATP